MFIFTANQLDLITSEKSDNSGGTGVDETNVNDVLGRNTSLNSSSDEFGASDTLSIDSNTSGQFVSVSTGSKLTAANDGLEEIVVDKGNLTCL